MTLLTTVNLVRIGGNQYAIPFYFFLHGNPFVKLVTNFFENVKITTGGKCSSYSPKSHPMSPYKFFKKYLVN